MIARVVLPLLACIITGNAVAKPAVFQHHARPAAPYHMANYRVRVAAHQAVRPAALAEQP